MFEDEIVTTKQSGNELGEADHRKAGNLGINGDKWNISTPALGESQHRKSTKKAGNNS